MTDIECSEETADFCDTRAGLMTTVSEVEAGEAAEAEVEGGSSTEAPVTKATHKNKKRATFARLTRDVTSKNELKPKYL